MKKWYLSKTLWVNIIAFFAIVLQAYNGFVITPEVQLAILAGANAVLRFITHESIYEKKETEE